MTNKTYSDGLRDASKMIKHMVPDPDDQTSEVLIYVLKTVPGLLDVQADAFEQSTRSSEDAPRANRTNDAAIESSPSGYR